MRHIYFPFVVLAIILSISWLNYRLLVRWTPQFRRPAGRRGFWALTALAFVVIAFSWSSRLSSGPTLPGWFSFLAYGAFAWLVGQIIMFFLLPLLYIGQRLAAPANVPAAGGPAAPVLSRRLFLRNSLASVPAAALCLSSYGVYSAESGLIERHRTLVLPSLPPAFDGLRLVQLSDTHIGPYFSLEALARVTEKIKRLAPDILVVTGDLIDDLALLAPSVEKLAALAPHTRHGVYFCWGNHEYFHDINRIRAALEKTAITIVTNSHRAIQRGQSRLYIAGVDYPWADNQEAQREKCRLFVGQALRGIPNGAFRILLAHHPDFLFDGFAAGLPLTLAGHTHGGQVVLFGRTLLPLQYHYMRGLYEQGGCYGYVNSGAGHWFPFRLGCPPEIAAFTLKKA